MSHELTERQALRQSFPIVTDSNTPSRFHLDGARWRMPSPPRLSSKSAKPLDEKITINVGCVDLGQIDLLVQEGFYANRTDLIRTAIRNQLASHSESVRQAAARKTLSLAVLHVSKGDLQALKASGQKLDIRVLGLATIDPAV